MYVIPPYWIFHVSYLLHFLSPGGFFWVYTLRNSPQYFYLLVFSSGLFSMCLTQTLRFFYFNNCMFRFQKSYLVPLKISLVIFRINSWSLLIFSTSFISFNILFIVILYFVPASLSGIWGSCWLLPLAAYFVLCTVIFLLWTHEWLNLLCGVLGIWIEDVFLQKRFAFASLGAREYFQTCSHFNFIINLKKKSTVVLFFFNTKRF